MIVVKDFRVGLGRAPILLPWEMVNHAMVNSQTIESAQLLVTKRVSDNSHFIVEFLIFLFYVLKTYC